MTQKRPVPIYGTALSQRRLCPVCQKVSYSREGIHPQCAQLQADMARVERLKAKARKAAAKKAAETSSGSSTWYRPCPRCKASVHVRKAVCGCGYELVTRRAVTKK
jgi:hypothetical protein